MSAKKNFRIKLSLLLAFGMALSAAYAQNKNSITGIIKEKNTPIEYANILLLKDSVHIDKVSISDSTGVFHLKDVLPGNYYLKVEMVGYQAKLMPVFVPKETSLLNLGIVQLQLKDIAVNNLEINSQRKLIKKTSNGFIFTAKDNITQAAGTATDLLRSTPTVVVDMEGGISIRGKSPLILVNGRNSQLSATDRIPASNIESIEIINTPPAQYDAEAEGGIINIKLKKNISSGTNGSVALGIGKGVGGRYNSAFIINHKQDKWNFGLTYDNRFATRTRNAEALRTNYFLPDEYFFIQSRNDDRYEQIQNLGLTIDFVPDKKNSFSLETIGNWEGQDNRELLYTQVDKSSHAFVSKNSRFSNEIAREKALEYALNYARSFTDKRKSLKLSISNGHNNDKENTDITTQSLNADNSLMGTPFLQRTYNYELSNIFNGRLDYAFPVSTTGSIEAGLKETQRNTHADYQSQHYINNNYVPDNKASNIFDFHERVHAAYFQYKNIIGSVDSTRWKYEIGLRLEQSDNNGKTNSQSVSFNNNYLNLFPTATLVYFVNPTDFIKLNYGRRINRPGMGQLNPFVDITDSLNPHSGNPYLKPELINTLEMGYNKEWKDLSFTLNVFYRQSTNIIRPYIFLDSNGVALVKPLNFGNGITYGVENILSYSHGKFYHLSASISVFKQKIDGSNIGPSVGTDLVSWYARFINNFMLPAATKLQVICNYNSPIATPQGTRIAVYNVDIGLQHKVWKGNGALGLAITDIFNTQKSGLTALTQDFDYHRTFKVDSRAVLLTFAYSFKTKLKDELLQNKFSND
ncbi:MAG: hypothetical protein RLZZ28_926 [Bacteroidota bacterium]